MSKNQMFLRKKSAKLRALRGLVSYVPRALRTLVLHVPRTLCVIMLYVHDTLHALLLNTVISNLY